ncbi:hypothetical protein PCE1_004712 [Barthelona sp. PCE]
MSDETNELDVPLEDNEAPPEENNPFAVKQNTSNLQRSESTLPGKIEVLKSFYAYLCESKNMGKPLTLEQIVENLRNRNVPLPSDDVLKYCHLIATGAVEQPGFEVFLASILPSIPDNAFSSSLSDLKMVFEMFTDVNGEITKKSLKRALVRLGENVDDDFVEAMMRPFDLNSDGRLSFSEFIYLCYIEE